MASSLQILSDQINRRLDESGRERREQFQQIDKKIDGVRQDLTDHMAAEEKDRREFIAAVTAAKVEMASVKGVARGAGIIFTLVGMLIAIVEFAR